MCVIITCSTSGKSYFEDIKIIVAMQEYAATTQEKTPGGLRAEF